MPCRRPGAACVRTPPDWIWAAMRGSEKTHILGRLLSARVSSRSGCEDTHRILFSTCPRGPLPALRNPDSRPPFRFPPRGESAPFLRPLAISATHINQPYTQVVSSMHMIPSAQLLSCLRDAMLARRLAPWLLARCQLPTALRGLCRPSSVPGTRMRITRNAWCAGAPAASKTPRAPSAMSSSPATCIFFAACA